MKKFKLWLQSPIKSFSLGIIILGSLGCADYFLFNKLTDISYLEWYLKNGTLIGLIISFVSIAWGDLNKNSKLVSAHPLAFIAASFWMIGLTLSSVAAHLRNDEKKTNPRNPFDLIVSIPFIIAILFALVGWIFIVTPLQYLTNLIAGAPARVFIRSKWRSIAKFNVFGEMEMKEIRKDEDIKEGWWDTSLFSKPVTITGIMSAMLLFCIKFLIG